MTTQTNPTVLIVCPTEPELRLFIANMRPKPEAEPDGWKVADTNLTPSGVSMWQKETGNLLVAQGAQQQLAMGKRVPDLLGELGEFGFDVGLIVLVGTCGAIKDLKVGKVIVPRTIASYFFPKQTILRPNNVVHSPTARVVNWAQEVNMIEFVASTGNMATVPSIIEDDATVGWLEGQGMLAVETEADGFFEGLEDFEHIERLVIRAAMDNCTDRSSADEDLAVNQQTAMEALMPAVRGFMDRWFPPPPLPSAPRQAVPAGRVKTIGVAVTPPRLPSAPRQAVPTGRVKTIGVAEPEIPVTVPETQFVENLVAGTVGTSLQVEDCSVPQFVVTDAFKLELGKFAEEHKNTSDEMKSSQPFWGDLLKILGVRWVPDGTFETAPNRGSAKADRIDVSVPGCFIAEQKSRKVNDFKPVWDDQVARYVESLGVKAPPIRIVCNFAKFEWEHVDGRKGKFPLEDLPDQTEFWELIIDTHNSAKVSVNKEAGAEIPVVGSGRAPDLKFWMVNIPVGSRLVSVFDETIACVTVDTENKVSYNGEILSWSAAAVRASIDSGGPSYGRQGAAWWLFNGQVVAELRETLNVSPVPHAAPFVPLDTPPKGAPSGALMSVPTQLQHRNLNFRFSMLKLPVGSVLVSVFDPKITCTSEDDNNQVLCGSTILSLSAAANRASVKSGRRDGQFQGAACWLFNGKLLSVLREEEWVYTERLTVPPAGPLVGSE